MRCSALAASLIGSAVFVSSPAATAQDSSPDASMLRFPDIGRDHIVFVYANDLWLVPRDGGAARRIASPPGEEAFPKFSPDGETLAFVGNYDGNRDLYVMPIGGGPAARVTHHPAGETLNDITPDGDLLYYAGGQAGLGRQAQLFRVPTDGGLPEMLPVPYGTVGSISPDGEWLAYTPHTRDFRTWKRYRGGMATDIWLYNLRDGSSRQMTDWEGTDTIPMWHGDQVYYLSDAGPEHRLNVWTYDPASGSRRQVTQFGEFDVKWPSMGPGPNGGGEIVFQHGRDLHALDLTTEQSRRVPITVPTDQPRLRPQQRNAAEQITSWSISPSGKRVAVSGRGDVWTLPAEHGSPRNLTRTSGAFERAPSWSPDGRWLAYLSDESGEYELYVMQSDGKSEPRRLTFDGAVFRYGPTWSPDSKHMVFSDKTGAFWLLSLGEEEDDPATVAMIDRDPWASTNLSPSWSHDSGWIAYHRGDDKTPMNHVRLYNVERGESTQVTSGMFNDSSPTFDRKGDWLFYTSNMAFDSPLYSDTDTTFIYNGTQVLHAVPLHDDVESPFLPESDEQEWKEEEEDDDGDEDGDEHGDEETDDADSEEDGEEAAEDDGVSGSWTMTFVGVDGAPADGLPVTATIRIKDDGTPGGFFSSPLGNADVVGGSWDPASGQLELEIELVGAGMGGRVSGTVADGAFDGRFSLDDGSSGEVRGTRDAAAGDDDDDDADDDGDAAEVVEIVLDGFEERALTLPVSSGSFSNLAVNDAGHLVYVRRPARGAGGGPSIKILDLSADSPEEKAVTSGGGFDMTADGKKLLVPQGGGGSIVKASAGASGKRVPTAGMRVEVDPREEWRQIFNDAWRMHRDFFYAENMHGVDWDAVRDRYGAMVEHCASREDLSYVIREMIAELNVGHAYYFGGDTEGAPSVGVGMLGVDYELVESPEGSAYRIARILEGAPWDGDARNPLREPGVDVEEGAFLLAVNGVPVDPSKDPWAAFIGQVGRPVTLTVGPSPVIDDESRDVVVEPLRSESGLRYRAWIERNRKHVEDATDGRVGYIYVPDTGVNGQNNLFRQFVGQRHLPALIIDERWNGGGQIPTRFIEMLNRPVTNYWARRDGNDWRWPPDAHNGPKVMLINGLAGSGGDAFPHYFRQAGLGKLVGTRTWGGLVGISGNPGLVDGGYTAVPTFGFYESDGTWGIEGHGVDPDIEVIDDPALMRDGGDPQLDAAIELMLEELRTGAFTPAARPAYPDRSGMGLPDADR